MSSTEGGLRYRLAKESLANMIHQSLTTLGWFNAGRQHHPLVWSPTSLSDDAAVAPNTLTLDDGHVISTEAELGSTLSENRWSMFCDFYAESDALGLHLINDLSAILRGNFASIGRTDSSFELWDYTLATPVVIATLQIEAVQTQHAHETEKPWQRHWYTCDFDIIDFVS